MNTKIVGIIIIVLGLAGLFGGAYFFYMQMFYVPDEQVFIEEEEEENQEEKKEAEEQTLDDSVLKTEGGSIEKILELPERKSVVISGKEQEEPEDDRSLTEQQLKRTASLFIERFGSYSNQSNFSNISDLKIFMTDNMKKWADNFIVNNNVDRDVSVYYGITTRSISQRIENFDESSGEATVFVKTLRRESGGSLTEDNSFYQEAVIRFLFEKGTWKVDKATWD